MTDISGLIYLHNLAGQALSQANARIAELEQEIFALRAMQQDSDSAPAPNESSHPGTKLVDYESGF